MVSPVPAGVRGARYRQTGPLWSLGWHTGEDWIAENNSKIVSCMPGIFKGYHYDKSFGHHAIVCYKFSGHHYHAFYCHMDSADRLSTLQVGDRVAAGQRIGGIGISGNTTGYHCHLELRSGDFTWKATNFRDPILITSYKIPVAKPPTSLPNTDGMVPLRIFDANQSCYNDKGARTYDNYYTVKDGKKVLVEGRFHKVAEKINFYRPDLVTHQELGNKALLPGQTIRALLLMDKLIKPSVTRIPECGSDGRYIHADPTDIKVLYKGTLLAARDTLLDGDDKQGAWMIGTKTWNDLVARLSVLTIHLENQDPSGKTQVKQFESLVTQWWEKCIRLDVPVPNRIVTGDFNSINLVREFAEDTYNLYSSFEKAVKKSNEEFDTINHWNEPTKNSQHQDYVLVNKYTPVYKALQINNPDYNDHGMLLIDTFLKAS